MLFVWFFKIPNEARADQTSYTISDGSMSAALVSGSCDTSLTNTTVTDGAQGTVITSTCVGRNDSPNVKWTKSLSWETMGVPTGATVTQIDGSFKYRVVQESHAATQTMGTMQLQDSADTASCAASDLEASFDPGAVNANFTTRNSSGTVNVSAGCQTSSTSVTIRMNMIPATGNNAAATSELRIDDVSLTITYTPAVATLTQNNFLIYVDNDSLDPTEKWGNPDIGGGSENSTLLSLPVSNDPVDPTDEVRIRMNLTIGITTLTAAEEDFILQYAEANDCTTTTSWTDVSAAGVGSVWEFADSNVTDNTVLSTETPGAGELNLTDSDKAGRYNKSDPTTTNPYAVTSGQDLEWDWHLEYVGGAEAHTYCFRMTRNNGGATALDGYNADSYPKIDTRPSVNDQMRHGNFFSSGLERGFFWVD